MWPFDKLKPETFHIKQKVHDDGTDPSILRPREYERFGTSKFKLENGAPIIEPGTQEAWWFVLEGLDEHGKTMTHDVEVSELVFDKFNIGDVFNWTIDGAVEWGNQ